MITSENKVPVPWFVGHDVAPIFPGSALATPCSDWTFSCSVPYIPLSVAPFLPGRPRSSPTSHRTFCDPLLPTTPHAPIIPECLSPVILPPWIFSPAGPVLFNKGAELFIFVFSDLHSAWHVESVSTHTRSVCWMLDVTGKKEKKKYTQSKVSKTAERIYLL